MRSQRSRRGDKGLYIDVATNRRCPVTASDAYGAFEWGGIDGKLGGLTPVNSYASFVCIRGIKINRPRSLAVTRKRVIVASY